MFKDERFAAASDFVDRFRSLKSDPKKVIFAAITGDVAPPPTAPSGWTSALDVGSYYRSLLRNTSGLQAPYVCQGPRGPAGLGAKYLKLAQLFGDNGFAASLCAAGDLSAELDGLAALIKGKFK